MSYILDALRKSDAQRRRGAPPALLAPQAAAAAPARSRTLTYGLLAAALVGAGVVVGTLRPWRTAPPAPATQASVPSQLEASPNASGSPPLPAQREAAREPVAAKPVLPAQAAPAPRRHPPARAAVAAIPKEPPKPASAQADAARPGAAAQDRKVPAFAELPVAVQQEIPKLSISVHAYSPVAKDRLVGINERVLHEGESVAPGLVLESITPDGMIMSYKGYRFQRGVR